MAQLNLYFTGGSQPALDRIKFKHPLLEKERVAVRGKSSGAFLGYCSFQWSHAVQGLAQLLIRAKIYSSAKDAELLEQRTLRGGANTPASSLDYAISKQPVWIAELFSLDKFGISLLRRLVYRTNSERKRPGDTIIAINPTQLPEENISIFIDGKVANEATTLRELLTGLESYNSRPKVLELRKAKDESKTQSPADPISEPIAA
jgi:hypothetical protein